jgi:glycosyltransferase involved in cell wall biosynthesis
MVTYNHENYIAQAIESVLMQKTFFNYRLMIGEDCSTDGTRKIVSEYAEKYPDKITAFLNETNLGLVENAIKIYNACTAKYIAMLEGDDYWTDPNKLQNQVDFLESNSTYSSIAHQSMVIYENSDREPHLFNILCGDRDFSTGDLIGLRKFHTASFMFRSEIIHKSPEIPNDLTSGDRALFLLCSIYGPIKYFGQKMCVYRKNDTGISSRVKISHLKKDFNTIPWIKKINPSFPKNRYKAYIHKTIIEYPERVSFLPLVKHYFLHVWYSFSYFPENRHEMRGSLRIFKSKLTKLLK